MPWTLAHPAAVLPLARNDSRWFHVPALVMGSMVPDVGYYIGQLGLASQAHTAAGLFTICLPIGMLLLVMLVLPRDLMTSLLPQPHRHLFLSALRPPPASWQGAAGTVLSVLVGAATHLAWDSFTHHHGHMVARLVWLRAEVFIFGGRTFHVYNLLQHLSTVAGVLILVVAYRTVLRRMPVTEVLSHTAQDVRRLRLLRALVVLALCGGVGMAFLRGGLNAGNLSLLAVRMVVYTTTSFAALYLAAAVLWRTRPGRSMP